MHADPGAGGLLPASIKHASAIDVALREDGRPAADSAHVMDHMPKPVCDTHVRGTHRVNYARPHVPAPCC